jgi:hypothetical protein
MNRDDILIRLKNESAALLPESTPTFYRDFEAELAWARETFFTHPLALRCQDDVLPFLNDRYGHGTTHAKKVAIEAGAIALAEGLPLGIMEARHLGLLAILAGLLHDVCRLEGDHAHRGADLALIILRDYPLTDEHRTMVAEAIRCHEAFRDIPLPLDEEARIVAGALYDADKFRWGPDNFVTTLWEICNYQEWDICQIADRFPAGLQMIASIRDTFRTPTGQTYGPEFIDLGLTMGKHLYQKIQQYCGIVS